jgi:aspartyl protease family protein
MATGFMLRHCMALALALAASPARAADVQLVGTFGDKAAVLSVDGGEPKTVRVGQRHAGVAVIAVENDSATIEVEGRRRVIRRGQHYRSEPARDSRQSVVLSADGRGHFISQGSINGGAVRFVVDTGATSVVLPVQDANRLGIDYRKGQRGLVQTANGVAGAWRVSLDRVRLGGIELLQVDAVVIEKGPDVVLLGMSFLNRVEMRRDGDTMTLTRRF